MRLKTYSKYGIVIEKECLSTKKHVISSFAVKKDNQQRVNALFHATFKKLRLLLELADSYKYS